MSNTSTAVKIKPIYKLSEPSKYKVLYLNDDVTTMEFVVESLIKHFSYDQNGAFEITKLIHDNGSATVALLPYELAEQKGSEVIIEAREQGYPLQIKLETNE